MGFSDSKSSSVTIRCNGTDMVGTMVASARSFALDKGLATDQGAKLAIIVEELVFNLIEHGGIDGVDEIELALAWRDEAVSITLTDAGSPFDPRAFESGGAIPERGGGAGLDLVRAWAEIVDYRSETGRNRIELRLPLT